MAHADIAKTMQLARKHMGFSQEYVGKVIGVSYQAISNYERGLNKIDSATLDRLCSLYNLDVSIVLKVTTWDNESYYEDYYNARSDNERRDIFKALGPCPEFVYDYQKLMKTKKSVTKCDGLSDKEYKVALAYRAASNDDKSVVDAVLKKYQDPSETIVEKAI